MTWRGPATNLTPAGQARAREYRSKAHRDERSRRVAAATALTPCCYCGQPLGPVQREWHLPHRPDRQGYEPGLSHASCNRREAARRGALIANARRKAQRAVQQTTYRW